MHKTRKNTYDTFNDLINTVSPYELIGLGEATHGNYKNAMFRCKVIQHLIKNHGVREVILEDDVFTMQRIEKDEGKNLERLMNELQYCFDNIAMKKLYKYIFEFNKENPADKVRILGADVQRYQTDDISTNSKLGKLYTLWAKYSIDNTKVSNSHSARDKAMFEMIKAQHKSGVKSVLIFHNDHLNKSAVHENMGYFISKTYPSNYFVVANTFTSGSYLGLFMPSQNERRLGLKTEFQEITITLEDKIYKGNSPAIKRSSYIWEGHGGVDKRNPMRYFYKKSSRGFDLILFINNETPLKPNKENNIFH